MSESEQAAYQRGVADTIERLARGEGIVSATVEQGETVERWYYQRRLASGIAMSIRCARELSMDTLTLVELTIEAMLAASPPASETDLESLRQAWSLGGQTASLIPELAEAERKFLDGAFRRAATGLALGGIEVLLCPVWQHWHRLVPAVNAEGKPSIRLEITAHVHGDTTVNSAAA